MHWAAGPVCATDSVTGPTRAEWVYDTLAGGKGKLTRSIRYEPAGSSNQYVNEVSGYDSGGRPAATKVTIPALEGGLCAAGGATPCTYEYAMTYWLDGQIGTTTLPAAGGLAAEKLYSIYDDIGLPRSLQSPLQGYVDVTRDKLGRLAKRVLGEDGSHTWLTYTVDERTGRLVNAKANPELKPQVFNYDYTYDDAGNLTQVADSPAGGPAETQCYRYDYQRRLADAWTPSTGDCRPAPTVAGLGGPARYWHSYTYDKTGNRLTEVQHADTEYDANLHLPRGQRRCRIQATRGYPGGHQWRSHQDPELRLRPGRQYHLPAGGGPANTCPGGIGAQNLTWDNEGRLARSSDSSGTTSYIYDADGNRLIRKDPGGKTLYLPGGTEVRAPVSGAATCTRYYFHAGTTVAVRTPASLTWLTTDHHNTGEATLNDADLAATRRRTLPFGEIRGTASSVWAGDKGFVGGTADNTALTHLGAREYDPSIGRFISVDPIMDLDDPQQMNGYSYANNSPITASDPNGLLVCGDEDCGLTAARKKSGKHEIKDRRPPRRPYIPSYRIDTKTRAGGGPTAASLIRNSHSEDDVWIINGRQYSRDQLIDQVQGMAGRAQDPELCEMGSQCMTNALAFPEGAHPCGYDSDQEWCNFAATTGKEAAWLGLGPAGRSGGGAGGSRPRGGCRSFDGATEVLMADGSTKPIKEVEVGDVVVATDPETGEQGPRTITDVWSHNDSVLNLEVGGKILVTTEDHPFWNATDQEWQRADELDPNDQLLTPTGRRIAVAGIQPGSARTTVAYNLTVADIHTYYVIAGNTAVLVHNEGDDRISGTIVSRGTMKIQIYANDHGPPHAHLKDGRVDIQIGQNGKPLDADTTLNSRQQAFVDENIKTIRGRIGAKMREYRLSGGEC